MSNYFNDYFQLIEDGIRSVDHTKLISISETIKKVNENDGTIFIVGNGGSAAVASHASVDFTKAAKIRATTFNESSLLT